jgi:polyisoprenoid-binding protein YceI
MMVTTVRGTFDKVSGSATLDDKDLSKSSMEVVLDAASINTRNQKRDGHLRSPDFFDAEKHPRITFKSTRVARAGKDRWKVTGDLTMRGVTKPVTLDVEGPTPAQKGLGGQSVRGVVASGKLNRKDWGLNWNQGLEAGGVLVSDEVKIQMDLELVEKPTAAAAAGR